MSDRLSRPICRKQTWKARSFAWGVRMKQSGLKQSALSNYPVWEPWNPS